MDLSTFLPQPRTAEHGSWGAEDDNTKRDAETKEQSQKNRLRSTPIYGRHEALNVTPLLFRNRCTRTYDLTQTLVLVDELLQRQVLDDVGFSQRSLLVLFVGQPESGDIWDGGRCE